MTNYLYYVPDYKTYPNNYLLEVKIYSIIAIRLTSAKGIRIRLEPSLVLRIYMGSIARNLMKIISYNVARHLITVKENII